MRNNRVIVFSAMAAILVLASLLFVATDGSTDSGKTVAGSNRPNELAARSGMSSDSRTAKDADSQLLNDFNRYINRIVAGDDSLSMDERAKMTISLERAVAHSPRQRAILKHRLEEAFKHGDVAALMELERAFNTTDVGVANLLEVYSQEIDRGGPLDYYALENASYFQKALSQDDRISLTEKAFSQMSKYDDLSKYNGAMLFLSNTLSSGESMPAHYRDAAISMIQDRLYQSSGNEEQYFTAQNLFRLMPPQDAAMRAVDILRERPTFSVAHATLDAIVNGRMLSDPTLIRLLTSISNNRGLDQNNARTLQELLARISSNQGGSTTGSGSP